MRIIYMVAIEPAITYAVLVWYNAALKVRNSKIELSSTDNPVGTDKGIPDGTYKCSASGGGYGASGYPSGRNISDFL